MYIDISPGCHDNGYVANLRSQITAGYKSKLVLLKSYTDMAAGISDLDLPSFSIPDLFMSQKLGPSAPPSLSKSRRSSSVVRPSSLPTLPPSPPLEPVHMPAATRTPSPERQKVAASADCPEPIVVKRPAPSSPQTYSFALKTTKTVQSRRPPTPELEAGGSSSSEESDDLDTIVSASFTALRSTPRQVDSSMVSTRLPRHHPSTIPDTTVAALEAETRSPLHAFLSGELQARHDLQVRPRFRFARRALQGNVGECEEGAVSRNE